MGDVIKNHRSNQLMLKDIDKAKEENENDDKMDDDVLNFDSFQQQTDAMEEFINKQWKTEQDMASDDDNLDMFQRALLFDEEQQNEQPKMDKNVEDDFAFLNEHIVKDSDDEMAVGDADDSL